MASFSSQPAFPPGGKFSSEPISEGSLLNLSGYQANYGAKLDTKPAGIEEYDGYTESADMTGQECVRYYKVPWGVKEDFKQWALGYSYNVAGTLRRVTPINHPLMPWLFCQRVELDQRWGALGKDQLALAKGEDLPAYYNNDPTVGGYGFAGYKCTFRNLTWIVRSDIEQATKGSQPLSEINRYVTRSEKMALQGQLIPQGNQLVFDDQALQNPQLPIEVRNLIGTAISSSGIQKLYPTKEVTYTWHEVPDVPEEAILACVGHVNQDVFDPPWVTAAQPNQQPPRLFDANGKPLPPPQGGFVVPGGLYVGGALTNSGYPAGTLLMLAPDKEMHLNACGRYCWTLIYKFLYRPTGWNYFPAFNGQTYHARFQADSLGNQGQELYPPADYNQLFTQPATPKAYFNGLY